VYVIPLKLKSFLSKNVLKEKMNEYKRNVGVFGRFLVYITVLFQRHSSFGVGRENLST